MFSFTILPMNLVVIIGQIHSIEKNKEKSKIEIEMDHPYYDPSFLNKTLILPVSLNTDIFKKDLNLMKKRIENCSKSKIRNSKQQFSYSWRTN